MDVKAGFQNISIIGLGLMGGSLAAACRRKFPDARITAVTRNQQALRTARKRGWIHEGTSDLEAGVRQADLIVLCTPVDIFPALLDKLDRCAPSGALITDVGSIKGTLLKAWRKKARRVVWVGAHPMAGSHERGLEAARPDLYDGHLIFLIRPVRRGEKAAFRRVQAFWAAFSKRVIPVSAEIHDRIVAEISHLPHAAASCLVRSVREKSLPFAASGFMDTTRIAAAHPSVWIPIFRGNSQAVIRALRAYERELQRFRRLLQKGDFRALEKGLSEAARKRHQI